MNNWLPIHINYTHTYHYEYLGVPDRIMNESIKNDTGEGIMLIRLPGHLRGYLKLSKNI